MSNKGLIVIRKQLESLSHRISHLETCNEGQSWHNHNTRERITGLQEAITDIRNKLKTTTSYHKHFWK